jgi:hypothetical protein
VQASTGLLDCLPSYEALQERRPNGEAAWLANSVLASRMQFLMGILAPCIPQLPEVRLLRCANTVQLCFIQNSIACHAGELALHHSTVATATRQEDMMGNGDR